MRQTIAICLFALLALGRNDVSGAQDSASARDLEQAVTEYDEGLRDLRAGRNAQAARKFESALKQLDNHPELRLGWGLALLRAGENEEAFQALNPLTTSNVGSLASSALVLQARIRFEEGNLRQAESLLVKAQKRDSQNDLAARLLGIAYARQAKFAWAIPLLKDAVERDPLDFDAIHLLGVSYLGTQQWEAAKPHLIKAHQMAPKDITVTCNLAAALLGMELYAEAAKHLEKICQADDPPPQAPRHLALALLQLGELEAAKRALRQAIDLDEEDKKLQSLWDELSGSDETPEPGQKETLESAQEETPKPNP